jgi:hypothetical protein
MSEKEPNLCSIHKISSIEKGTGTLFLPLLPTLIGGEQELEGHV